MTNRDDFSFLHLLRVRWGECDAQGIVFNVNYFLYFDVGITEYFRALGYSGAASPEFYTVHAEADFRAPAVFDDEIEVAARCARLGVKSMTMKLAIFRGDELLTEGTLVYAHAERGARNAAPLPREFVARILAFEKIPPERKTA